MLRQSWFSSVVLIALGCAEVASPVNDEIDNLFADYDENTPGCAVGVVQNGEMIYAKGYGMADLEHDIPITPSTVFYTGSVSKQFVTMCVLLLEEQGKIDLDAEIQEYLPDFPIYGAPLTVRHFIHHTSGVRDYLTLWGLTGGDYLDHIDEDAVYRLIKRQKELNFTPGDRYLYSNSCYFMLAMIVEKVSGKSFREFADNNIFKPLGMENSHFHDNYLHIIKDRAFSYSQTEEGYNNLIMRFDLVGSGGMYSNIEDMVKWDRNFDSNILGKGDQQLIDLMHEEGVLNNGESTGYAFALANGTHRGLRTVGHGGALAGYRSHFLRFPDQGLTVILLGNFSAFNSGGKARQVAEVYLRHLMDTIANTSESDRRPGTDEPSYRPSRGFAEFEGTYYSEELDVNYDLFVQNDTLFYQIELNDPLPLGPAAEDTFSNHVELVFKRDDRLRVTGFDLNAGRVQGLDFARLN